MTVRDRLEDASLLWGHNRRHGAWIQILIATAATSKKRFPQLKDGESFRKFIRQVSRTIITGDSSLSPTEVTVIFNADSGDGLELDKLFYKHLRCNLLHEAMVGPEIVFSESTVSDGQLIAELKGGDPLTIPDFWALHLALAVATAAENVATCGHLFQPSNPDTVTTAEA